MAQDEHAAHQEPELPDGPTLSASADVESAVDSGGRRLSLPLFLPTFSITTSVYFLLFKVACLNDSSSIPHEQSGWVSEIDTVLHNLGIDISQY